MHMLTKFESKSNRVKGLAFHPRRPWILASLHNGTVQLWDYRMGTLLDKFDEHDGPVRGVAFHPKLPLFATGGDDYKIRVWSYKERRCLFTLNGHLDYVRTVAFHSEEPWILSASDDQTIRFWNWQSRQCVAVVTGHSHYVMSAAFHPTQDLVVSASMDQTVRVWDITGLRAAAAAASGGQYHPKGIANTTTAPSSSSSSSRGPGSSSSPRVVVKFILEGHDRGVDWAAFHPTQPLIVSGGDDRQVRIWRISGTRAWEAETLRGHFNNVSSVLFHPRLPDVLLSASEDRTLRVWDLGRKQTIKSFRREHERFWMLAAHPSLPLFAAGHDGGLLIFKLDRERPAMTPLFPSLGSTGLVSSSSSGATAMLYVRDREVRYTDVASGEDVGVLRLRALPGGVGEYQQARSLAYQPQEKAVLVIHPGTSPTTGDEGSDSPSSAEGLYSLYVLGKSGALKGGHGSSSSSSSSATSSPTQDVEPLTGPGSAGIFVGRQRFVVLDRRAQTLTVRDFANQITRTVTNPGGTEHPSITHLWSLPYGLANGSGFPAPTSSTGGSEATVGGAPYILLGTPTHLLLYGLGSRRIEGSVPVPGVRYVVWDTTGDGSGVVPGGQGGGRLVAVAKHTISLVYLTPRATLELGAQVHETIRIKSASFVSGLSPLQPPPEEEEEEEEGEEGEKTKRGPSPCAKQAERQGVMVVYTTLNHLKFTLANGDAGVLRTLEDPIYLTHVRSSIVQYLTRSGHVGGSVPGKLKLEAVELLFKRALLARDYGTVMRVMSSPGAASLVGQSVIGYVQKRGHPELAMQFVRDPSTRLALALQCGDLQEGMEAAKKLAQSSGTSGGGSARMATTGGSLGAQQGWRKLGERAMELGQSRVGEVAWQKSRSLGNLSLLYALVGERDRMGRMAGIYGTGSAGMETSMWLGDVEGRVEMLLEIGQAPLAYLTAKTHGLEERAREILAGEGKSEEDGEIVLGKKGGALLHPPIPVSGSLLQDWPLKRPASSVSVELERLSSTYDADIVTRAGDEEEEGMGLGGAVSRGAPVASALMDGSGRGEGMEVEEDEEEEEEDGEGWGEDEMVVEEGFLPAEDQNEKLGEEEEGVNPVDRWTRESPMAVDHVAAGSVETAMQLLHRQAGIIAFAPLKPHFLAIRQAAIASLGDLSVGGILGGMEVPLLREPPPLTLAGEAYGLDRLVEGGPGSALHTAYSLTTRGKFPEAMEAFRSLLHRLAFTRAPEEATTEDLEMYGERRQQVLNQAVSYILGLGMERARRSLSTSTETQEQGRALELAAYFTHMSNLTPGHLQLALNSAMKVHYKAGNYLMAASFARRLLDLEGVTGAVASQAKQIKIKSDQEGMDTTIINYDANIPFTVCAATYKPITLPIQVGSGDVEVCGYCGAAYLVEEAESPSKGEVCVVCEVGGVGQVSTGLMMHV
ncbi:MAG: coatomer protein alpha subunit [Piptocephalis tieghemiana]|nr:MAG: coatomer protein alpha subunit [Piptocephalis tieghemiana]